MAGGAVTLGGQGIDANGTTQTGRGGVVRIETGGALTTTAAIKAAAVTESGPGVSGGGIDIRAASIAIGQDLTVSGFKRRRGQAIRLRADGDITVTAGVVDAGTASGDGGVIAFEAGGTIDIRRPLRANGVGSDASGGTISLVADTVKVSRDLLVRGGDRGGVISIEAARRIDIGTGATTSFDLDADRASNNPGAGGEILLLSEGHDVYIGPNANLTAKAQQGGEGGAITIAGIDVFAATGSRILADGSVDAGGSIEIEARGRMSLNGILHANNGDSTFTYRQDVPIVGAGVTGSWTSEQDDSLDPPCGDGTCAIPSSSATRPT